MEAPSSSRSDRGASPAARRRNSRARGRPAERPAPSTRPRGHGPARDRPDRARVTYRRLETPPGFVARLLWGEGAEEEMAGAVAAHTRRILDAAPRLPGGDARFGAALEVAFASARERSPVALPSARTGRRYWPWDAVRPLRTRALRRRGARGGRPGPRPRLEAQAARPGRLAAPLPRERGPHRPLGGGPERCRGAPEGRARRRRRERILVRRSPRGPGGDHVRGCPPPETSPRRRDAGAARGRVPHSTSSSRRRWTFPRACRTPICRPLRRRGRGGLPGGPARDRPAHGGLGGLRPTRRSCASRPGAPSRPGRGSQVLVRLGRVRGPHVRARPSSGACRSRSATCRAA